MNEQIKLITMLKRKYGFRHVAEYPRDPISAEFPINWKQINSPRIQCDLLFTWRAFPKVCMEILKGFQGRCFMLMATNLANFGVFFQRFLWSEPELYCTRKGIEQLATNLGLTLLESGYYDCPLWIDAPLPLNLHIDAEANKVDFERLPFKYFRAHHVYALGERV